MVTVIATLIKVKRAARGRGPRRVAEWLIEHSITRGKIERPPTEMVLGIYNHTK